MGLLDLCPYFIIIMSLSSLSVFLCCISIKLSSWYILLMLYITSCWQWHFFFLSWISDLYFFIIFYKFYCLMIHHFIDGKGFLSALGSCINHISTYPYTWFSQLWWRKEGIFMFLASLDVVRNSFNHIFHFLNVWILPTKEKLKRERATVMKEKCQLFGDVPRNEVTVCNKWHDRDVIYLSEGLLYKKVNKRTPLYLHNLIVGL